MEQLGESPLISVLEQVFKEVIIPHPPQALSFSSLKLREYLPHTSGCCYTELLFVPSLSGHRIVL